MPSGRLLPFSWHRCLRSFRRWKRRCVRFLLRFIRFRKLRSAPLMIMWFGLGNAPKIILAGGFVFFIVFMNVVSGIQSVNRNHINIVRVMGGTRVTVLRKIVFPTAIPFLFLGLRLAIPEAMIGQ